jgi:hypothetical protein
MRAPVRQLLPCLVLTLVACGDDGSGDDSDAFVIGDTGDGSGSGDDAGSDAGEDATAQCTDNLDCRGGEVCRDGTCRAACTDDDECADTGGVCGAGGICVDCETDDDCGANAQCIDSGCVDNECASDNDCGDGEVCSDGECIEQLDPICEPGAVRCDGNVLLECDESGTVETPTPCEIDQECVGDDGEGFCRTIECEPFALGCVDTHTAYVCANDGIGFDAFACREDQFCVDGVCAVVDCEPSTVVCDGESLVTCGPDGTVAGTQPCATLAECAESPGGCACRGDECVVLTCVPGSSRCVGNATQTCSEDGATWGSPIACDEPYCVGGQCTDVLCEPGTVTCDGEVVIDCPSDGGIPTAIDCADSDRICENGACEDRVCEPASVVCNATNTGVIACDSRGSAQSVSACADGTYCSDGACVDQLCDPGASTCEGDDLLVCNALGSEFDTRSTCASGCTEGACNDPCEEAAGTHLGCSFWTVDLENYRYACSDAAPCASTETCVSGFCTPSPHSQSTRLYATNASPEAANVTIYNRAGGVVATGTLAAGNGTREFNLAAELGRTSRGDAWNVVSDQPISITQDNPASDGASWRSGGTSLLLPTTSLGTEYVVSSWAARVESTTTDLRPYFTVIGTANGTDVTVEFTAATVAGPGGAPAAVTAGTVRTYTVNRGEALQFATPATAGLDFTGTRITATQPISVFSGHACANVPTNVYYCDHLEEQLLPVEAARTVIPYARSLSRGTEPDMLRVVATANDTLITTVPVIEGVHGVTIGRGEDIPFLFAGDAVISASQPVFLAQYQVGADYPTPGGSCLRGFSDAGCAIPVSASCASTRALGDPAFAIFPPMPSRAGTYSFAVPPAYAVASLAIVATSLDSVTLDGVEATLTINTVGGYQMARMNVASPGRHVLSSDTPFVAMLSLYGCGFGAMSPVAIDFR